MKKTLKKLPSCSYMYLLDGYCSYLIAQQVGPEFVKIKMVRGASDG